MDGIYAYTPDIWPPLAGGVLLAALSLYCWLRREVPAARSLAASALCMALWLLALAIIASAVAPAAKIAWFRFQGVWLLPGTTAAACFALEYAYPGRWLTRRNLALLALPVLLCVLCTAADDGRLLWRRFELAADGSVLGDLTAIGLVLRAYGIGLGLVNAAALLWLFVRSPQHRWPATLMLFGLVAGRAAFVAHAAQLPSPMVLDLVAIAILAVYTMYAVALFGFRIFDPRPAARIAALDQMRDGMVVFDAEGRVASLNPRAASMLGVAAAGASGRTLRELLPSLPDSRPQLTGAADPARQQDPPASAAYATEITLGTPSGVHRYNIDLSPLRDFRGLLVGRLLMLHDLTEQRRAEAALVEHQRTLAVLQERERLARELHDSLGQVLAAAHLQASTARRLLEQGDVALVDDCLGSLAEMTLQAEADVRDYLLGARTVTTADQPFFPMVREYFLRFTRQYGLPVELDVPSQLEEQGLAQAVAVQLFRIIQEALSNVRKHAGASFVRVGFSLEGAQVRVVIADDGHGFAAAAAAAGQGFGLRAMRERAEELGGSLDVISTPGSGPGHGTRVVVHVPLKDCSKSGGFDTLSAPFLNSP